MHNRILQNTILIILMAASILGAVLANMGIWLIGMYELVLYVVLLVCIWLFLSLNLLRRSMNKLYEDPSDKSAENFTNMFKGTIAAETFIGKQELTDVYTYAIKSKKISYKNKVEMYDAFSKKYIHVPYPHTPKKTAKGVKEL